MEVIPPPGEALPVRLGGMATQSPMDVDVQGGRVVRIREFQAFKADVKEMVVDALTAAAITVTGVLVTVSSASGTFLADDGSAAAPAYAFSLDENTGVYRIGDDTLGFSTGGSERMRISSAGTLGLGMAPSANSIGVGIDIASGPGIFGFANNCYLNANLYYNAAWYYKATAAGVSVQMASGEMVVYTTPSGTANTAATLTERLRLTLAGQLQVADGAGGNPAYSFISDTDCGLYRVTTDKIALATGGFGRLFINSGGFVGAGLDPGSRNNCVLELSSGLGFPATQIASSDVNVLDDYEEGTWTPTITANSGTFTTVSASGEYTKIGNRVLWFIKVTITTNGTAATYVIASGFPFTFGQAHIGNGRETAALGWQLQSAGNATGSAINILKWDNTYPTDGNNGRELQVNGHFRV